jgi:hypothetical protein
MFCQISDRALSFATVNFGRMRCGQRLATIYYIEHAYGYFRMDETV